MADQGDKPQTLVGALATLGSLAGFLWGGSIGADGDAGFFAGAFAGSVIGGLGGLILGAFATAMIKIAIAVCSVLVIITWLAAKFGGN